MELILACAHGEPRGKKYCALCRFDHATRKEPIDRQHVAIHKNAQETSRIAASNVLPKTGTKRRQTYELIKDSGMFGLCDHEIEEKTGWLHQSASSIRNGLMRDGWIKDSGQRRTTPSGNPAIVWIID